MNWRRKRERDLQRELDAHLDLETEEQRGDRYAARRSLGNTTLIKEDARAMWGWGSFERLWRDIRLGARMIRRRPVFTGVAILSLTIGIGTNSAIFSFVNAILLKELPVTGADRLVIVRQQNEQFHIENCCFTYGFFQELRRQDADFEDMLALRPADVTMDDSGQIERLQGEFVTGNYFSMLGVRPAAGRLLDPQDEESAVCVISYRLWQERFGGRRDAIGRRVLLNREPFQIVGVTQAGFTGAALHEPHDLQIPPSMVSKLSGINRDKDGWAQIIARLKPTVSREQALAHLNILGRQVQTATTSKMAARDDFLLRDGSQGIGSKKEQLGRPVLVLFLLVAVVLLVACANLAALLLVRSVERAREAGVRVALGASKLALFRQFFSESLLVAGAGGIAGWALASLLVRVLLKLLGAPNAGLAQNVQPDITVFLFSAAVTILASVLFGVLPAWRAARADPLPAIQGAASATLGRRPALSRVIVAGQLALSFALLFCAGLFTRTLSNLRSVDLGFNPENVIVLRPDLRSTIYSQSGGLQFFEELRRRAGELPETRAASLSGLSLLSGSMQSIAINVPGYVPPNGLRPTTYVDRISPGYFRTLGIPLLAGRDLTEDDRGGDILAAIVNQQFATQFLGGNALGKDFASLGGLKFQVVGVVGASKFRYVREEPQPILYLPYYNPLAPSILQVRTTGDPEQMIARLRALLQEIDPLVPIESITTMEMQIDSALARERMLAFLSELISGVALVLSAIGLYGVLAFSVVRRTREIGIRLAVGAERKRIAAMFLRESAWTVLGGMAAGVPLAIGVGRLVSSLLYGLKPQDAATAIGAIALLVLVSLSAALLPALRASRVDPLTALRHE